MQKKSTGLWFIALLSVTATVALFFIQPIPQDITYHNFADTRTIGDISNFWNVMSNSAFLLVGLAGLYRVATADKVLFPAQLTWAYTIFFIGVSFVAIGSGYYHLAPGNFTLVWDRLPMTIAFMALFSIIIGEYIAQEIGQKLLVPLLLFGFGAVGYWHYTETLNRGDLRLYLIVQFLPMLIIPFILLMFRPAYGSPKGYWGLLACYVVAKLCEHYDAQIFHWGYVISGHSLKHWIAAIGVLILVVAYWQRRRQLTIL